MSQQGVWLCTVIQGPKLIEALPFPSCPHEIYSLLSLQQKESYIDRLLPWPGRKTHNLLHNPQAMAIHIALPIERGLGHAGDN